MITVLSREDMMERMEWIDDVSLVVSISNYNQPHPDFVSNPMVRDICFLYFDDVEDGFSAMTADDADELVTFIHRNQDIVDAGCDIYVHCGAGVSRSAAVAAALLLLLTGDDSQIFDDGHYCPNMHCYHLVLDAAGFGYTDDELSEKEARNWNFWRILHADELE